MILPQSASEYCHHPSVQVAPLREETKVGDFSTYNQRTRWFPSETELIQLVCLEYELGPTDKCVLLCQKSKTKTQTSGKQLSERGWSLVAVLSQKSSLGTQHGAAFWNRNSSQLVIVHRGTEFTNLDSLRADATEVMAQEVGRFGYVAYSFTKRMTEKYGAAAVSISVTGHSLGGWLAQVATFYMKHPEYCEQSMLKANQALDSSITSCGIAICDKLDKTSYHVHCVSFDGPGCKEVVAKIFPRYLDDRGLTFRTLDSLDITVYLTRLNFTNIVNEQIGSVFQMKCDPIFRTDLEPESDSSGLCALWDVVKGNRIKRFYERFRKSHSSSKICEFWRKYDEQQQSKCQLMSDESVDAAQVLKVTDWLTAESAWHYVMLASSSQVPVFKPRNLFEFRMSCFDQEERDTIQMLLDCKERYKGNEKWDDYLKWPGVQSLTSGFQLKNGGQTLEIYGSRAYGSESEAKRELYRDYFIRTLKLAVRNLDISGLPPDFQECVYISETSDYVKSLPQFTSNDSSEIIGLEFGTVVGSRIILISVPMHSTHLCTAKIHQMLHGQWLRDPVQYLVVDSSRLVKLGHIFRNRTMGTFLPSLKHVLIECTTEYDFALAQAWIVRLCTRGGGDAAGINIAVVHSLSVETLAATVTKFGSGELCPVMLLALDECQVRVLCSQLSIQSLLRECSIQFKFKGQRIHLNDLVPLSNREFYNSLDSASLYTLLQTDNLGVLLPKLDHFEEKYYFSRKFRDPEVLNYSKHDLIIIITPTGQGRSERIREWFREFVLKQHTTDPEQVICWEFASFDAKVHKILIVDDYCVDEIVAYFKECGGSGYVLEQMPGPMSNADPEYKMSWRNSFGKPGALELGVDSGWERECRQLVNRSRCSRLTLIVDEPGMGKTTIMQKLAVVSQKSCHYQEGQMPWTIFVPLDQVAGVLRERLRNPITLTQISEVLSAIETRDAKDCDGGFEKIIGPFMTELLQKENRVFIFFDGLDEVAEDVKSLVLDMTKVLLEESKARIQIASRKRFVADPELSASGGNLVPELQKIFGIPSYTLTPFTQEEGAEFLIKYWTNHKEFVFHEEMDENILAGYVKALLDNFRAKLGSEADKFVGIPFQLRMLASAYMRDPFFKFYEKFCRAHELPPSDVLEPFLPIFTNLVELYKLFQRNKIEQTLIDKGYARDLEKQTTKEIVAELESVHMIVGFDKIFSAKRRGKMIGSNSGEIQMLRPTKGQIELINAVGLFVHYMPASMKEVESDKSDETEVIEVIHRTVAEFLAAEFILKHILKQRRRTGQLEPGMQHFLDSYLFLARNEKVFNFLNLLIMTNETSPPILGAVTDLVNNLPQISNYFQAGKADVDCLGRNLMHYIIIMHQLIDDNTETGDRPNLNWFLVKGGYLCGNADVFEATPFAYVYAYQKQTDSQFSRTHALFSLIFNYRVGVIYWKEYEASVNNEQSVYDFYKMECEPGGVDAQFRQLAQNLLRTHHQFNGNLDFDLLQKEIEVIEFIVQHQSYLGGNAIGLRANSIHAMRPDVLDSFPIAFALELDGESRIGLLTKLPFKIRHAVDNFDSDVFTYLQHMNYDDFGPYKKLIKGLELDTERLLLGMLTGVVTGKALKRVQNALHKVWESTQFVSLQRALRSKVETDYDKYVILVFLNSFYHFLPVQAESNSITFEQAIRTWLSNFSTTAADATGLENIKFVGMVPIICRVLSKMKYEAFIVAHEETLKYTLRTELIQVALQEFPGVEKRIVCPYYSSLYCSQAGRRILMEHSENANVSDWLNSKRNRKLFRSWKALRRMLP